MYRKFICAVLLLTCACYGEFESRISSGVSTNLNDDWSLNFKYETRIIEQQDCFDYNSGDIGFSYKGLHENIKIGLNYKVSNQLKNNQWRIEQRPYGYLTYKNKIKSIDWSNRVRIEYREFDTKEDLWRLRNKFGFKFPYLYKPLKLRPYIADEVYYQFNDQGYSKNRIYGGCTFNLTENFKSDIYYFWEKERESAGGDELNVLGLKFTYYF